MPPSETMKTPPVSSTANELPIFSPRASDLTAPVERSTVPTTPAAEQHELRVLDADADSDDPPGLVERDRRALGALERGSSLHVAPERARARVGVRLVGVVVDVAPAVRRHEGVRRHARRLHRLGLRR